MIIQEDDPQEKSEEKIHKAKYQKDDKQEELKEHSYLEMLLVKKTENLIEYDLEIELRNVFINIPLLQAIKDIPIYIKIIKDLCIKKTGRKKNKNQNVKVINQLTKMISNLPLKHNDLGNVVVTIEINGTL